MVIIITPFEPLEPYIAVEAASFKTSILSMSDGLMEDIGLIVYELWKFEIVDSPCNVSSKHYLIVAIRRQQLKGDHHN